MFGVIIIVDVAVTVAVIVLVVFYKPKCVLE